MIKDTIINEFKTNLPSRKGALVFTGIAVICVLAGIGAIAVAEMFMPENQAGQQAVLTFYRAFAPWAFFWLIGACCAHLYLQYARR